MLVVRGDLAINLNTVTHFEVRARPYRSDTNSNYIIFEFGFCDDMGHVEYKCFKFENDQDAKDAFSEIVTRIAEGQTKVFYMDDRDLWPERKEE